MVDYSALRKKFPTKDPQKRKRIAAIKAIEREYAAKRAALGGGAPTFKKGIVFYAVVILGLMILGSLVLSVTGKGGPKEISRAQIQVRKSIDAVAVALGRYRYHVGRYPSTEEGLERILFAVAYDASFIVKERRDYLSLTTCGLSSVTGKATKQNNSG